MKAGRIAITIGGAAVTALAFFGIGRLSRGDGGWQRQHINKSNDSKVFQNSFLGLQVQAPEGSDWQLVWEPAQMHIMPASVNKVLEFNRTVARKSSDSRWARMDLFVEPLGGGATADEALGRLEFREKRPGFKVIDDTRVSIGGMPGTLRIGEWRLKRKRFRSFNYHAEYRGRLYAFIGVSEAPLAKWSRPIFDQIITTVQFD